MREGICHIQTWQRKLGLMIQLSTLQKVEQFLGKKGLSNVNTSSRHSFWADSVSLKKKQSCWIPRFLLSPCSLLPGATMISFFLERIRRNVRSFWGSMSRTVLLAFMMKLCMRPAYWMVVELSMVLLMGIPAGEGQQGSVTNLQDQPRTGHHQVQPRLSPHQGLGVFSLKARGKHEEKQDMKKLRCGTTGGGENYLPLVASVLYFCILSVGNRNKLNKNNYL